MDGNLHDLYGQLIMMEVWHGHMGPHFLLRSRLSKEGRMSHLHEQI